MRFFLLVAFSVVLTVAPKSDSNAQVLQSVFTIPIPQEFPDFGRAVAFGDVDADGYSDLVIGSRYEDVGSNQSQGRVYVFSGFTGSLLHSLTTPNPQAGAEFGFAISTGYIDADNKADIAVGARAETVGANAYQGRAYVFSGGTGQLIRTLLSVNPQAYADFGISVATGDVDADGRDDVVVGSWGDKVGTNNHQGRAYVFSGLTGAHLMTVTTTNPEANANFGYSVALGDVDGDGHDDLASGGWGETVGHVAQGRVYLFSGVDGAPIHSPMTTPNPQAYGNFGWTVDLGDFDGDGKADLGVSAPAEAVGAMSYQGRAYVYSGATGLLLKTVTTPHPQSNARFGEPIVLDDLTGDGLAEVIVGAVQQTIGTNTSQGRVYIFSGMNGLLLQSFTTLNPQPNSYFGGALAVGSLDPQGTSGIAVGVPFESVDGVLQQGRVYLFSSCEALVTCDGAALALPFPVGETWHVCQGYNGQISHQSTAALDLSISPSAPGSNGCTAETASASTGRDVLSPADGVLVHAGADGVCISFDYGGSAAIGHIGARPPTGSRVEQGELIGTVNPPDQNNGGYAHIHIQSYANPTCVSPRVPFSDLHGARFQCAPDLPYIGDPVAPTGPDNLPNQYRALALTRCSPDTDRDGCTDTEELGGEVADGGGRDPLNRWDFADVPTPALPATGSRSTSITLQDVSATLAWVGRSTSNATNGTGQNYQHDNNANGVPDGAEYDRTPAGFISGPPNGAITLSDVGVVLGQVGHSCLAEPN